MATKKLTLKSYQIDGLQAYITGVVSKKEAALILITRCRWGIMPENLIEIERIPEGVPHYGIYNKPSFDPREPICIDMLMEFEHLRDCV